MVDAAVVATELATAMAEAAMVVAQMVAAMAQEAMVRVVEEEVA